MVIYTVVVETFQSGPTDRQTDTAMLWLKYDVIDICALLKNQSIFHVPMAGIHDTVLPAVHKVKFSLCCYCFCKLVQASYPLQIEQRKSPARRESLSCQDV